MVGTPRGGHDQANSFKRFWSCYLSDEHLNLRYKVPGFSQVMFQGFLHLINLSSCIVLRSARHKGMEAAKKALGGASKDERFRTEKEVRRNELKGGLGRACGKNDECLGRWAFFSKKSARCYQSNLRLRLKW